MSAGTVGRRESGGSGGAISGSAGTVEPHGGASDGGAAGEAGQGGEKWTSESRGGASDGEGEFGAAGDSGAGGEREAPDTTPPTILSISPDDGAHAVRIDADVVVTFSEPMNELETEASFEGDAFLPSHTTFSWSNDGTVIHSYSFTITSFARDLAGNHLARDESVTFDTGHTYSTTITLVDARIIRHVVPGPDQIRTPCITSSDEIQSNEGLLLTFSFEGLAQLDSIVDWKSAALTGSATDSSANGTELEAGHVIVPPANLTWDVPIIEQAPVIGLTNATRMFDVTDGVRDDFVNRSVRSNYTQYFIRFVDTTAAQNAALVCGSPSGLRGASLEGEYVAP